MRSRHNQNLHGVILTPPLCNSPVVIEALNRARTRFVRIAPEKHVIGAQDVRIDDHKAAFDMTAYLLGLGHKRIGFIKGHPDHRAALARFEGYRAALAQAGLPLTDELIVQGYFSYQSGMEAGERLLTLKKRPTAIFASNDDMAAAVLAASQRFNLKIPSSYRWRASTIRRSPKRCGPNSPPAASRSATWRRRPSPC